MKILIVGAGQVGNFLCERLSNEGHEVILIDRSPDAVRQIEDRYDLLGVVGNGASAEVLEQAGIKSCDIFIAVTDLDEVNILSCLLAREYAVETRIARVKSIEYGGEGAVLSKEKLGIDLLINPDEAVADEIARIACRSGAFDVAEFAEGKIQFLGYRIDDQHPLCNLTLREIGELRGIYSFVVTAISREGRILIPRGDDVIQDGDEIFVFAHQKEIPALQYLLTGEEERKRQKPRAFILSGGQIGQRVARELENLNFDVRLVEKDFQRCERLASSLNRSMIIHADETDIRTLIEEGVEDAEIFIAVSDSDETNILSALLCRQHGVKRTLALVNRPELLKLAPTLGIDACLSPRVAAAAAILKYVRRGDVISIAAIEGSDAEVLEFQVKPGSAIIDRPLSELHFPANAIIGAIVRPASYEIPTGETRLRPDDRIVVFALPEALTKVERFFE